MRFKAVRPARRCRAAPRKRAVSAVNGLCGHRTISSPSTPANSTSTSPSSIDDLLRRDYHNETIGILICGTKNDRSVRYSLGRSMSPMAAYTYDKLPEAEQEALPGEVHLVAALEWAEPGPEAEETN